MAVHRYLSARCLPKAGLPTYTPVPPEVTQVRTQCVAVFCSMLQCGVVCCIVLYCVIACCRYAMPVPPEVMQVRTQCVAVCCSVV